jgi:hypothetical protein
MEATLRLADVAEGVRAAIAAYTLALDDGRTDDIVATFCPDGSVDIPGMGAHQGHDALREAYARVVPRHPQRHVVVNTLITGWDDRQATATSDVLFLFKGEGGWAIHMVGRYLDTLHHDHGTWRFHHRAVTWVT